MFGSSTTSASDLLERLQQERRSAAKLVNSCAWRTREHAEAALEVLDGASIALDNSCPSALAATFVAVRSCQASLASAPLAAAALGPVELLVNERLATCADSSECIERRQARLQRTRRRFATVADDWCPKPLGNEALALASEVEGELAAMLSKRQAVREP